MTDEKTGAAVRSIASRGMRDPASLSLEEIRSVCASALTQSPNRRGILGRLFSRRPDG